MVPTEIENRESGMALLLLWEIDHHQSFPSLGERTCHTQGFTKRLEAQVTQDARL